MMLKVGLVLLLCWSFTCSEPQAIKQRSASETLDLGYVPSGVYETVAYYEPGAIGILFHMVHGFLHVVQPNPFPRELITKIAQENFRATEPDIKKPENIVLTLQALQYEMGFMVCAVLGALFVLLMPLAGLCFCVCRCCDNCGGEMHQRQRKNADCKRTFLASGLFATSLVVTAGVVCAYSANQNLTNQLKGVRRLVNSNMRDLQTFVNQTPLQIDYLTSQYFTVKNKVISDLGNIGPLLGGKIQEQLGKKALPALDATLRMTSAIRETKQALENVSVSIDVLKEGSSRLQVNLSRARSGLEDTLSDPACSVRETAPVCGSIRDSLHQLNIDADFSKLPDVSAQLAKVDDVLETDLSSIVQKGYSSFNKTPALVEEQTRNVVKGVESHLDSIGTKITGMTKKFPMQAILANFTMFINHVHSSIEDFYPQMDQTDFYRWVCCISLCCVVVLILAFNFLGLLCGICGHDKHASPTTRGCISNTGGNLIMAGVGFTFIFSWVLMAVVASSFVVGGNVEKLVCEPFGTKELFKVVDTPYLVNAAWRNFIPGFLYNNPDVDLTAENLYSNCKENRGLYSALHLENMFNITALVDSSMYAKDISVNFEDVKVDLTSEVLLEDEGKQNLISFTQTGIGDIKFQLYLAELNKTVTAVDLLKFANELDALTDQLPRSTLESGLRQHARNLRHIHNQQVVPLKQDLSTLRQSIHFLEKTSTDLSNKVTNVLGAIEEAQYLISNNATYIINQEVEKYMRSLIGYFESYTEWVMTSLTLEVGGCKPLSNVVDTAEIVACSLVVDSMNAFWFGLGWAALFLIPNVVFSVRLAKFYRRMDTEDVYDDAIDNWN
uniref:Prominin 1a n=1 Tax=Scleropages formosus TaxID=113540 RepID=A0A8C9VIV2_SCLFO